MNAFTFFALMICTIFAMVSGVPSPMAPAEMVVDGPEAIPGDDVLERAESRGYGYSGRGGRWRGRGHYGHYGHGR